MAELTSTTVLAPTSTPQPSTVPAPGTQMGQGAQAPQPAQGPQAATSGQSASPNGGTPQSLHQKGRSKIPWSKDVWDRIDQAVTTEVKRTRIGGRFLPVRPVPPKTTSVPTDSYSAIAGNIFSVDEGATVRLNEYYVEFELTPQQVDQEEGDFKQLGHSTAVTLATKAANMLALAEDLIIFQGQNAIAGAVPFTANLVQTLGGNQPADTGLLNFPIGGAVPGAGPLTLAPAAPIVVVPVPPLAPVVPGVIYGPNTFSSLATAYSNLQAVGRRRRPTPRNTAVR
jgi:encapsulating protein for peroxidase